MNFYKELIALRTDAVYGETVVYGRQEPFLPDQPDFTGFYRKGRENTLLVLANIRETPRTIEVPLAIKKVLLDNCCTGHKAEETKETAAGSPVCMQDFQFLVLEVF